MPFLYNVHTPNKTFALAFKDGEQYDGLIDRIAKKAGLGSEEVSALKQGKDGSGLVYEFEGGRWSLEDDDDLGIMRDRLPPSSTSTATLHLSPPHAHAHFAPPSYNSASALKKSQRSTSNSNGAGQTATISTTAANTASNASPPTAAKKPNGTPSSRAAAPSSAGLAPAISAPSHHFPHASHAGNAPEVSALSKKVPGEKIQVVGHTENGSGGNESGHTHSPGKPMLAPPKQDSVAGGKAPSVRSTMSRKSRYGNNDAEPLWETKKRAWLEFHNGTGVRTVMGKVGQIDNGKSRPLYTVIMKTIRILPCHRPDYSTRIVKLTSTVRMLLKPGYKGVYVSRSFAIKAQLVDKKYAMGSSGYTGLRTLGQVPITVAGRTASHSAMISEEAHFDVVLGRSWVERMNVKIDPNDQTILTYMDSGESIPCDIVVLKDDKGNKIHIT